MRSGMAAWRTWIKRLYQWTLPGGKDDLRRAHDIYLTRRGAVTHVVILDGTMASLLPGFESNAGHIYRLLSQMRGNHINLYYEAGLQWQDWGSTLGVLVGR